jgi:hypothetical protein
LRRTHTPLLYVHHKSEPVLEAINLLLNISCSSTGIETLLVKERFKTQQFRSQLNIILQSTPGSLKTTILEEIGRCYGVTPYSHATYAAMIGSINRTTGRVIPGLVWETRKKPLLLDEFKTGERGDSGAIDVLLGVIESGHYKRRIGFASETIEEKDGPLYYRVRNGEIEVQTRFACIIATMKNLEMSRSVAVKALRQRCIPIKYDLPDEVVDAALQGSPVYRLQEYDPHRMVVINRKNYDKINHVAKEIRDTESNFREAYTRSIGDLCRIFAVIGRHDIEYYRLVCFLKAGYSIEDAMEKAKEGSH